MSYAWIEYGANKHLIKQITFINIINIECEHIREIRLENRS